MPERTWFFAHEGQQKGPYPEAQFRDLAARGNIGPDTLVWSEGMSGWQRAGEIPGLLAGASRPPAMSPAGRPPMAASGGYAGGTLSIDFGILEFTWRTLVMLICMMFVLPAPWALVWYMKWIVPKVSVPGRPNLAFEGRAMTIVPWYFGIIVLAILLAFVGGMTGMSWLGNLMYPFQIALYWLFLKWTIANVSSNGQPLGLSFSGSFWAFFGWTLFAALSILTIIGWAWVYAAMIRWICRNMQGTRREITFNGTGLEFLWRMIVFALCCVFIIPIPWMYRWFWQWMASQTVLGERGAMVNG